jgi:hypothetical protein
MAQNEAGFVLSVIASEARQSRFSIVATGIAASPAKMRGGLLAMT